MGLTSKDYDLTVSLKPMTLFLMYFQNISQFTTITTFEGMNKIRIVLAITDFILNNNTYTAFRKYSDPLTFSTNLIQPYSKMD
jgi:hypothetical protein